MKRLLALILALVMVLGLLPVSAFAAEQEEQPMEGKTISILGDSISTYSGYSNGAAAQTTNSTIGSGAIYYPRSSFDVTLDSTWWYQAAEELDMEILVNNSWSGSCLLNTRSGTVGAYVDRCVQLHDDTGANAGQTPDIIAIFLGTNDYYTYPSTLGSFEAIDFDALILGQGQYAAPTTSMEAYAIILDKISHAYPQAEVYCFTLLPRVNSTSQPTAFNADIVKLAQKYGASVVDLFNCGISSDSNAFSVHMGDNLHPNNAGMDAMTNAFVSAVLKNSDKTACDVTFELDQVLALEGTTRSVIKGRSLEARLKGLIPNRSLEVRVQMGGVDITDTCYAEGLVSIQSVTDDLVITASLAERSPQDYYWQFSSDALVSLTTGNNTENPLTMTAGSITDGKFSQVKYTLQEAVVLKHDRPWVLEWSSSGNWTDTTDGALLFAGSGSSTTENAPYLYRRHNSDFIAFGVRTGGQYHNYGVSLKNNGIDGTVSHVYRLENRVEADGSNMVYLYVDGQELGAMTHHWVGGTDKKEEVSWLDGQDLIFTHMGTSPHTIGGCSIDYIRVLEAGEHGYEATVTYPTKVTPGYTDYFCDHCAQGYRTDWLEEDAYQGKTIACVGDSITYGVGVTKDETDYVTVLAQKLGMNYIRLGKSGTTLCTGGKPACNISQLTESNLKGADVVTILMGVNDFVQAASGYYQLGDLSSTDTSTIYGAARMWCERIQELRQTESLSHTQFYFLTPVITSWNNSVSKVRSWDQSKTNIHGYTLRDLCNAIVEVSALYDVPVIDLNLLSGLYYVDEDHHNTDVFGGDGAHPGDQGHEKMAQAIAHRLLQNHLRTDHDHDFGPWVTTAWPTCVAGQEQQVCSICSATQSRTTRQHNYAPVVTDPTCTAKGYTTYICQCGDSYVEDYLDALGHTAVTGVGIRANSLRPGVTPGSHCSTCGEVLEAQQEIPAKGYDWMLEDGEFKLLLIGNSFSQDASSCGFGMTESQLYNMLQAMLGDDVKVTLGLMYSGGKGVHWYATQTEQGTKAPSFYTITPEKTTWTSRGGTSTQTALTWTDWDVVTLQPYDVNFSKAQEGVPAKYEAETDEKFYPLETATEYMLDFIGVHAPQADVYCYMHWARSSATVASLNASLSTYQKFAEFYPKGLDYLGTETGNRYASIIPVGLSIQNARTTYLSTLSYNIGAAVDLQNDPQIGLQRDGGHVTFNLGRYIAGLTFAEMLIPQHLRVEGYVLPEIRVTESVGKLPWEYTRLAQWCVTAAVNSWQNGSLAVANIDGYTEDPTVAAKETLEKLTLNRNCGTQDAQLAQIREAVLSALPADFAVDAVALDENTATVTVRFGYHSVTVDVACSEVKHTYIYGICSGCGDVDPSAVEPMSMEYDDHLDITGKTVEILEAGVPTSYQVGYGVEENKVLDTAVVTVKDNALVATGIGTAKVRLDGQIYKITVTPAPISLLLLIGQSNMRGSEGDANQSIVCPDGMVYATFGDDRGDAEGIMNVNNATNFAPSALTGAYSTINVNGNTDNLSYYPVNSLTEAGAGTFGPDSGFAYEWVRQTGEKVWVVNAAHGGSAIASWQPNATNYKEAVLLFDACQQTLQKEIAAGHYTLSHMGYFWCQGCNDVTMTAEQYVQKYLAMHEGLKNELAFDHDGSGETPAVAFEFAGIIPILYGVNSYRAGEYKDQNTYNYYQSFEQLTFNGPRVAQYWLCNNPEYEDIWMVCNIGEDWVWMPDGTNGVAAYFAQHYENGKVDYTTQVPQKEAWYTPTTPAAVHDSIHYNQIGYNEVGRESVRNALIMLGVLEAPEVETQVELLSWDGYTPVEQIAASMTGNSGTLVVPKVYPLWKTKQISYTLTQGYTWNYYDVLTTDESLSGVLTVEDQQILLSGHQWSPWQTLCEPSPEGPGFQTRSCPHCGKEETQQILGVWQTCGLSDHLVELPENLCGSTNLWPLLPHEDVHFTSGKRWGTVAVPAPSVTIALNPGDRIFATSFMAAGANGGPQNGIRLTFFDRYGVAWSVDPGTVYNLWKANGYIEAPEGTVAANIVMWYDSPEYELYILNRSHRYEKGVCVGCGAGLPVVQGLCQTFLEETAFGVRWDALEGAAKYWVYVNDLAYTGTTDTSATISSRTPDTSYEVKVVAVMQDGTILALKDAEALNVCTPAAAVTFCGTATENSIDLTWDATGCEKTWIYMGLSADTMKPMYGSTTDTFTVTGLGSDTTYYFRLAHSKGGQFVMGDTVLAVKTQAPKYPISVTGLKTANVDRNSFAVTWDATEGADKYWVYLNGNPYGSTTNHSFTIAGRTPNTAYEVKVLAVMKDGFMQPLNKAQALTVRTLDVPVVAPGFTAVATQSGVVLTWDATGCDKTWIYIGNSEDTLKLMYASTTGSFTVTGLDANTTYYFRLAHSMSGKIVTSEELLSVKTTGSKVTGLTASDVTQTSFDLTWEALPDAAKYWIYLNGVPYGVTAGTSFTVTNRTSGTAYEVKVVATLSDGTTLAVKNAEALTVTTLG